MARIRFVAPLLAALACAAYPAAARATDGPIAAYGFEESSTSIVTDNSGNGHNGTMLNGAAHTTGHSGNGVSFDGVDDRIEIPDSAQLDLTSAVTLEAWVKSSQTAGWRSAVLKERGNDLSYALYASGPDNPDGQIFSGDYRIATSPTAIQLNTWTHIAMTYDGSVVKVYMNGSVVSSTAYSGPIATGSGPLDIGGNRVWTEFFKGVIDDVRVYDRALTASEITSDMNTPVVDGTPPPPPPPPPPGADKVGSWTEPEAWPMVAVHTSMLANGEVVAWDGFEAAPGSEHVWDPTTDTFVPAPSGINLFCSGHVLLPDGRLFTAGGHFATYVGLQNTELFNPTSTSWTAGPDMAYGRWYPTTTTLADGRVLIVSGDSITQGGPFTPFYTPSQTVPEIYDPKTNTMRQFPAAGLKMPLYPQMFVGPDGRVWDVGPDTTTHIFDPSTATWSTLASKSPIDGHSAVMYRPGKILKSGTWTDPDFPNTIAITNKAAVLDVNQTVPTWQAVAPMNHARTFHTLSVLPDGNVLALGGQSKAGSMSVTTDPVLTPEIWNPDTNTWTDMAQSQIGRGYHNTSLLLPDGRILLAGSGRLDGSLMPNQENAEIFSPPYLFKGARPTITYAPPSMPINGHITVKTPDAASVTKVTLVRTGAVTHNLNMDQRYEQLSFHQSGADLVVDAPTSFNDAPPGIYYLFLLNANGVPSKAAILSISGEDSPPPDTQAPTAPSNLTATGALGKVTLNWTASTDNVGVTKYDVYRSTTSGFTPSSANLVATVPSGTSYLDSGLAAGTYYYRVIAEDLAGNKSPASNEASGTAQADTTAPTVSVSAPAGGATVGGTISVTASASDDVGVAGVQFKLDGANLGSEDTSSPYGTSWDTTTATAGPHTLTAVARDAAGHSTTSAGVSVTVDNSAPPAPTPVAAYSFDAGSGTTLADVTGKGHTGTIREAVWTSTGKNGGALKFDGTNDWVSIPDAADLHLSTGMTLEAWVNPTKNTGWHAAIVKERTGDLAYALYPSTDSTPLGTVTDTGVSGYGEAYAPAGTTIANNTWTHLAATYDGSSLKLYKNGALIATTPFAGSIFAGTGSLYLGGDSVWGEFFAGQLDDVRIYNQALTAAQITTDMNTAVGAAPPPPDTQPPTAPSNLAATGALGKVTLNWTASTDNVGVTKYDVHRSTTSGFTPSAGNQIATVSSGTTYSDSGLAAGTYYYRVIAEDAAGNKSAASAEASGTAQADTTAPTVSITAPTAGATVGGTVSVTATASDDVGVAGVQFKLDGANLGSPDTSSPYSVSWDTTAAAAGPHTLTAVASDAAGNSATSASVGVTVDNSAPPAPTPVAAYSFDAGSGTTLADVTGKGHTGTIREAVWTSTGKTGGALKFDGTNDWVSIPDATDLHLSTGMTLEAWVNPTKNTGWRAAIVKERTGDLAYALYPSTDSTPLGTVTDTGVSGYGEAYAPAGTSIANNTWTHLATTYDGSSLKLYKNGTLIATTPFVGSIFAGTGSLYLGGDSVWGEFFAGQLDDVRIYNQALTATQIQTDMGTPVH